MGKFGYAEDSDTGNWNAAKEYSETKIMKWLALADDYEIMATFGTSDMAEEFTIKEAMKTEAKVKALKWLTKTLLMVANNTWFAVKSTDKEVILNFKNLLERIEGILPTTYNETYNQVTHKKSFSLTPEFDNVLAILIDIKRSINEPLNRNDLIFLNKESFDPKKVKENILDEMINEG